MALVNYATHEINVKIVYYGVGLCGKTTNLQKVYQRIPGESKGKLAIVPTQGDRTIFLDFFPFEVGEIKGFKVRFHIFTVPGQVFYNTTRKLVLRGADGVVFVADSQIEAFDSNRLSFHNLKENLLEEGKKLDRFPLVIQYNKRDLPNISTIDVLNRLLNEYNVPFFEAVASQGRGVVETLRSIGKAVIKEVRPMVQK
ncbi:MAG TPA: GTPase domain-containing protein [Nitrospiria bacterium]|jgi:hypothetical protein